MVPVRTVGDRFTDRPFHEIGPKGIFAHELQRALASGEIDIAVHSLKDLPAGEPDGLCLAAILERGEPRDVLISGTGGALEELPAGTTVGTSSARRSSLLGVYRPDLRPVELRGNVDTRLGKVERGEVGAALLAGAGILRLGREGHVTEWLPPERFVPPPGQGAVAIEVRRERLEGDLWWIPGAEHGPSRAAVDAERVFMGAVEGGCTVPLGAWARYSGTDLVCDGFVGTSDGAEYLRDTVTGPDPQAVGGELAERLLAAGAARIIAGLRDG